MRLSTWAVPRYDAPFRLADKSNAVSLGHQNWNPKALRDKERRAGGEGTAKTLVKLLLEEVSIAAASG